MDKRDCESVQYGIVERAEVQDALPTSTKSEENGSWDQEEEMENQHDRNLQIDEGENQTIKIGFWNVAGLLKKDRQFWEFVEELDFIGLTETWMNKIQWEEHKDTLPKTFNWKCHYAVREKSRGRSKVGLITGVKKWINEEETVEGTNNISVRKIIIENEKWRIITVYSKKNEMKETRDDLQRITKGTGGEKLVIGGDFNARASSEKDEGETRRRRSKDTCQNAQGKILIEMAKENGWDILNGNTEGDEEGNFTFIGAKRKSEGEQGDPATGKSVIDYVMINPEVRLRVKKFTIENRSGSDHLPIVVELYKYAASENQKAKEEEEEEKMKNQEEKNRIDFEEMKVNEMVDDPTQKKIKARNKIGESNPDMETKEEIQSLTNGNEIGLYNNTETARLQEEKALIPETQAEFRRRRATEYILNIASRELQLKGSILHTFFANLKASFDNVNREKFSQMMEEKGISIADLEEYMKEGQSGVAIGNRKKWTVAYRNGIVLIAKTEMELQEMIDRLKNYLQEKDIILNEEESQAAVIKQGQCKEKENE